MIAEVGKHGGQQRHARRREGIPRGLVGSFGLSFLAMRPSVSPASRARQLASPLSSAFLYVSHSRIARPESPSGVLASL